MKKSFRAGYSRRLPTTCPAILAASCDPELAHNFVSLSRACIQGEGTNYSFTSHTALHWAAAKGHASTARWLIAAGAPVTVTNASGATPLHAAADNQHMTCIEVLLLLSSATGSASLDALQVSHCLAHWCIIHSRFKMWLHRVVRDLHNNECVLPHSHHASGT